MQSPKNIFSVEYRNWIFTVKDYFLCENGELSADVNYFIQCKNNIDNNLAEFYTLLTDLSQEEKKIWENIYHRTQTEIKSFLNNTKFEHEVLFEPNEKELKEFIALFNSFAEMKKIRGAEVKRLHAYRKAGILAVSFIRQDTRFTCINFYRFNSERASNLHSFTLKHLSESEYSASHYGRAHRALHWLDILAFKKTGTKYYDFCGWYNGNTDQHLLNINAFKEQFCNNKVKEYSGVVYKNPLLAFLKKIKNWTKI